MEGLSILNVLVYTTANLIFHKEINISGTQLYKVEEQFIMKMLSQF